jgi:hypothetical protein
MFVVGFTHILMVKGAYLFDPMLHVIELGTAPLNR